MKIWRTLLFGMIASLSGICSRTEASTAVDLLVRDNTRFAFELYGKLAAAEGNLFYSPYSISTALTMTSAGARGNTATEMAKVLRLTLGEAELHPAFAELESRVKASEREGIRLSTANALWPQKDYSFLPNYLALAGQAYGALVRPVDFRGARESARLTINSWVEKETGDKIRELIQPADLTELTRMVLVNAIYFKGKWAEQFKPEETREMDFQVTAEQTVQVPMMSRHLKCRHASYPDFDIAELPYAGGTLSMVVLLPKEIDGLWKIECELSADSLAGWLDGLGERELQVFFPKFKVAGRFDLGDTLISLGMVDAFSAAKADFSGMDGRPGWLYLGAVIHQALAEVNEEGTEAAAATAVVMETLAIADPPPTFRADHPFIFLIRENETGSILFLGRLVDPSVAGR